MTLLRLLSWPYARKHRLRTLLTIAGIVLGTAVFVAMNSANQSVLNAMRQTVNRIAGTTQLQVTAGDTGFDEEVIERVQALPEVRVAAPVIEAIVESGIPGQGNLLVLAVDFTGDRSLRDYDFESADEDVIDDPLIFLAQADSVILTRDFAARNGLHTGSKLTLQTMEGRKELTVRGLMRAGGLASAFGGNLAVMDIYAAQKMFGRGRKFDRIDLAVNDGVSLHGCRDKLRALLGPGFDVDTPSSRGDHFDNLLRVYKASVNLSSWFALFIGMFIIYNSFSIAVTQRRGEIGILRALGATERQIRMLFLGESAVAGLVGSALGIVVGIIMARGLTTSISGMLDDIYGVAGRPKDLELHSGLLISSLLIGVATSLIAALVPARNAARVDPVKALQKGRYQVLTAGESRVRAAAALVCVVLAGICLLFQGSGWAFYIGYFLTILAALLLTPFLAMAFTRVLRPLVRRLRPIEGALAADSLLQAPRRTSATVAAVMLSLAMIIAIGGIAGASYRSIEHWLEATFNPQLFVTPSPNLAAHSFHFPASMIGRLRAIPEIEDLHAVRIVRVRIGGAPVVVTGIELDSLAKRGGRWRVVAGERSDMFRRAHLGEGLIASENLAQLQHLSLGSVVDIPTPSGILRLPIVGIQTDFTGQEGSILIDRSVFIRYWKDDLVDTFRVYLKPSANVEAVKQKILEMFSGERRLFVLFNTEIKDYIRRVTNQWFGMIYIQILVAVMVAVLGIVNTLTVSIADRRRELGVLRAVGGLRQQIRHTIWLEAALIGVVGLALGLSVGALNLFYQLKMVARDFSGLPLDYEFPWRLAAALVPVILGAALAASIGPAESAVRGSLVEALEYE